MSVSCQDNSTECLLRLLIETTANQTSPWEPRSFGFTVAIGVAAFLISFVAIFQGLLAAGPGRIKASTEAIGAFSKLSRGRLSWTEFAWRSTAWTPVIIYDDLKANLTDQRPLRVSEHGTCYSFQARGSSTGTTWSRLLGYVGLDDEVDTIFDKCMHPCSTDHLPTDIQGPPAAIQLRCLAIFAAIADGTTEFKYKTGSDERISIQGRISGVSYREHPVLGTLAAYEHYQTQKPRIFHWFRDTSTPEFSSWGRCTWTALNLAEGCFDMKWYTFHGPGPRDYQPTNHFFLRDPAYDNTHTSLQLWPTDPKEEPKKYHASEQPWAAAIHLMVARTDYELRPFPWKMSKLEAVVPWIMRGPGVDLFSSQEKMRACLSGVLAKYAESEPWKKRSKADDLLFEAAGTWIMPLTPETPVLPVDASIGDAREFYESSRDFLNRLEGRASRQTPANDTTYTYVNTVTDVFCTLKHIDVVLRSKRDQALRLVNRATKEWTAWSKELEAQAQAVNQVSGQTGTAAIRDTQQPTNMAPELAATDTQTTPSNGSAASSTFGASATTSVSSDNPSNVQNLPRPVSANDVWTPSNLAYPSVPQSDITEEKSLQYLLMIRAVFYAALLEAGPDTSVLWEPTFKNSIVKMM